MPLCLGQAASSGKRHETRQVKGAAGGGAEKCLNLGCELPFRSGGFFPEKQEALTAFMASEPGSLGSVARRRAATSSTTWPKTGRWFSCNEAAEANLKEWHAAKMLLSRYFPHEPDPEESQVKRHLRPADVGGLKLVYRGKSMQFVTFFWQYRSPAGLGTPSKWKRSRGRPSRFWVQCYDVRELDA